MQRERYSKNMLTLSNSCNFHSLLSIQDRIVELVKIRDINIVKLKSRNACMYMKSLTVLFLFTLKHCIMYISNYARKRITQVKNLKIQRFQIPDDLNKEGKGLMGIGAVISAQIVKFI